MGGNLASFLVEFSASTYSASLMIMSARGSPAWNHSPGTLKKPSFSLPLAEWRCRNRTYTVPDR